MSAAVWVPATWLMISGARFPSEWLGVAPVLSSPDAYLEGSALDRNVFLALMLAGFCILLNRGLSLRLFWRNNTWIALFLFYAAVSILWSDFPLTAFKRWHKVLGHVVMVLVVLTERQPVRAFGSLLDRSGYILVPVSILLIKYFPAFGRAYGRWTDQVINTGATSNKNALGNLCLVFGLYFVTTLLSRYQNRKSGAALDLYLNVCLVLMIGWLLTLANSSTSLACLVLGLLVLALTRVRGMSRRFSVIAAAGAGLVLLLQQVFDLRGLVIEMLGRDATLTGRTDLWGILRTIPINPFIGVGFESFWLGERARQLWQVYWWQPNQAHNGYLETYLNIGAVGLLLQVGMMMSCYRQILVRLGTLEARETSESLERALAAFRLAFLVSLTAYNLTEATFKAVHLSFFVFFLVAIRYPPRYAEDPVASSGKRLRRPRPVEAALVGQEGQAARASGHSIRRVRSPLRIRSRFSRDRTT